jgi:hypothetical protein
LIIQTITLPHSTFLQLTQHLPARGNMVWVAFGPGTSFDARPGGFTAVNSMAGKEPMLVQEPVDKIADALRTASMM